MKMKYYDKKTEKSLQQNFSMHTLIKPCKNLDYDSSKSDNTSFLNAGMIDFF